MQGIKFIAVDKKTHVIGMGKTPKNKTFIFSFKLVVKVDEREKTEGLKKTEKCVSKARKIDNPEEKDSMNVHNFLSKHLVKNEK